MGMELTKTAEAVLALSALAGAVHVLAPDHWLPASVLSWQRGWSLKRSAFFAAIAFLIHVLLGLAIYFGFESFFAKLESTVLAVFGTILVVSVMAIRLIRFSRLREVLRAGPNSVWGYFAVISLLGPCEAIIPIFVRARHLGIGYLTPFLAFSLGTVVAGVASVLVGRVLWNRPLWLPRGITWAHSRTAMVPVIAGLALGLTAILRIS